MKRVLSFGLSNLKIMKNILWLRHTKSHKNLFKRIINLNDSNEPQMINWYFNKKTNCYLLNK